jgi:outer membrane protein assembly factor BamB
MVLLLAGENRLNAYSSTQVALDSNLLVDGDRVIFAQGTGSLTVLDLETGKVLLRKRPKEGFSFSGRLENSAHGVLMLSYDRIFLLDRSTFDPVWQARKCYDTAVDGEYLVSHDGDHTVTCRIAQSGKVCWTVDLEGGWHVVAAKGKALVAATDVLNGRSALLLLDLQTGRKLARKDAPSGARWLQAYFDGDRIFVVDNESSEPYVRQPGTIMTLDLQGNTVAKVRYSSHEIMPITNEHWNGCSIFIWNDKYFAPNGQVRPLSANESKELIESPKQNEFNPILLASGTFGERQCQDVNGETGELLHMMLPKGSWKAYAPYLGQQGRMVLGTEAQGRLLLGDSEGHVECMDIATGRPHWLYMFPVINQTVMYSVPYGMPPYLTERAAAYRQSARKTSASCGSIIMPPGFDPASSKWSDLRKSAKYAGQIVADPDPDDPFSNLAWYRVWLAACGVLPMVGVAALLLARLARRKLSTPLVIWFLLFSLPPALGLLLYGRVSHLGTLALKVVFAAAILCAAYGAVQLYLARRWRAGFMCSLILVLWAYFMWYPWWFA